MQAYLGTFGAPAATLGVALLGVQVWIATQSRAGRMSRGRAALAVTLPWLALAAGAGAGWLEVGAQLQALDADAGGGPLAPYRARLAQALAWADLAPGVAAAVLVAAVGLLRRHAPTPGTDARRARVLAAVAAAGALAGAVLAGAGVVAGAGTGALALTLAGAAAHAGSAAWRRGPALPAPRDPPDTGDHDDEATLTLGADATRALRGDSDVTVPRVTPPGPPRIEVLTLALTVAAATLVLPRVPVDPALHAAAEGLALAPAPDATPTVALLFAGTAAALTVAGWLPALLASREKGGVGRRTALAWGAGVALTVTLLALATRAGAELGARAGAHVHAVAVAGAEAGGSAARFTAPLPARVLVAYDAAPRWVNARPRGGVDVFPLARVAQADAATAAFGGAGAALVDGDGVLLDPRALVVDLYLLLSDARVRSITLVACDGAPVAATDALGAAGRCLATPIALQRPRGEPRSVIVLKGGEVDDGGEVRALDDVRVDAGVPVLVRAQADARVSDLLTALAAWEGNPLALGWGVDLDGEPIPVGARP